ncbi:unnamed protein product [Danaus chrysippus]|uniref:(African queen) hypothetical protein n=1 Tax=Danaus chrysippus TaxID=151541 RepID=A0A8J2R588_9NEOP|nr:unnamed protein product [Danaus chrysippus]
MRVTIILTLCIVLTLAAPQSKLEFANNDNNGKQFIEEVVVESVLHVKSPTASRQGRTSTDLQTGARVQLKQ